MKILGLLSLLFFTNVFYSPLRAGPKEYPGESLFHLSSVWTDQDGKSAKLSDLSGQTLVLALVYTSCDYSCPLVVQEMKRIKDKVSARSSTQVRYVLVSMDPLRDKPKVLKDFATQKKLDSAQWSLLTAKDEDSVRELAAVLGISYKKTGKDFAHSNLIAVINKEGVIVFSKPSLGEGFDETIKAIEKSAVPGSI